MTDTLVLDGTALDLAAAVRVARAGGARVRIADAARARIRGARAFVDRIVEEGRVVYGVSTGFGKLADRAVAREDLRRLQHNLIVSHAVGMGADTPAEAVRLMMLLRINALLRGHSGVREETVDL
ncbi:MAG TPA: aromatic amino acid lyase, partial [Planctomycetota bacterium]|nr:aromatic amino acid lyase [Planctomycetota bacterium]